MNGDLARKDDMDGPDPRLVKLVQQLDTERAARLKAERQLAALWASMSGMQRRQSPTITRDAAPSRGNSPSSADRSR